MSDKLSQRGDKYSLTSAMLNQENEQLRAQLAERDKEIDRLEGEQIVGGIARHYQLMRELSRAKETIADFRSALEFYATGFSKKLTESMMGVNTPALLDGGSRARETLSKHPDSTEVKDG